MDEKQITAEPVETARSRWFHLSPDRLVIGLLLVISLLWLSERFQWFGFNHHKGWTVLIAVAAVGAAAVVVLAWWIAGLIFRWRFQFGIRSLLAFCLTMSIAAGWLAVEMRRARRQADVVTPIRNSNAWETYDWQFDADGRSTGSSEPPWPGPLWKTLGIDFFSVVVVIHYTDATDAGLENLKELTHLRELSLDSTKVTDAGLAHLNRLTELRYLGISYTDVTDAGLEHLKGLTQLRKLDLSGTNITDAGLAYLKELTLLVLNSTRITDAGLAHLRDLKQLRLLDLCETNVADAGLEQLRNMPQLQSLGLDGTKTTDVGLLRLKELTQLRELYVHNTKVTDAGVNELQKALPNCTIFR